MRLVEGRLVGWVQPTITQAKAEAGSGGLHPPYEFSECLSRVSGR